MGAILCTKELKSISNIFIFNLSIADFCISALVDSFTAIGVLCGKNYFDERPGLCEFVAFSCLLFCEVSLFSIGFLALNRFIKRSNKTKHKPGGLFFYIFYTST